MCTLIVWVILHTSTDRPLGRSPISFSPSLLFSEVCFQCLSTFVSQAPTHLTRPALRRPGQRLRVSWLLSLSQRWGRFSAPSLGQSSPGELKPPGYPSSQLAHREIGRGLQPLPLALLGEFYVTENLAGTRYCNYSNYHCTGKKYKMLCEVNKQEGGRH